MVAEVLLHVGMHKTGTTALQMALDGYDDGTNRYARLGFANHSIPIVTAFLTNPHGYHVWKRLGTPPERVAQERAAILSRLDAELDLPHRRLLVVGEEISLLNTAATTAMARHLRQGGRQVSAIGYLRDPAGYVTAAFQQQVRGGQSSFALPAPLYRGRFEKVIGLFGPAAMTFCAYAPDSLIGGSIITDYCTRAGLPADSFADRRDNRSLPAEAVRLIHLFNRTGPVMRSPVELAARSAMIAHVAASFSTRFTLDPFILGGVVDPADLDWIEAASGIDLGHRYATTDREQAEAALAAMLANFGPRKIDWLHAELAARGQPAPRSDGTAELVGRLYQAFLAEQHARSAAPRNSAAG